MISHADTVTTPTDEHCIGVVGPLIKGKMVYHKHVQHAAKILPQSPASNTSQVISPTDLITTYQ